MKVKVNLGLVVSVKFLLCIIYCCYIILNIILVFSAALVEGTILCMHGGLSPDLIDVDQVCTYLAVCDISIILVHIGMYHCETLHAHSKIIENVHAAINDRDWREEAASCLYY